VPNPGHPVQRRPSIQVLRLDVGALLHQQPDALILWKRRERWIRQTIVAIVEIHKRGIFVRYVDLSGIWVDSNDNISIITFKSVGFHIPNRKGYMPLELRRFTAPRALATGQSLTSQSDVFQLGLFV
jgi:serine/threonine protein kinase